MESIATSFAIAMSTEIVCPHCQARNRVPAERLHEQPQCGKCQQPLFQGAPQACDSAQFYRHVQHDSIPVLVDFWAPWCGPCRMMAPEFARAAQQLEPAVRVIKVDTEANPDIAQRYGIRSIPTLALFHGGNELARQAGAMQASGIVNWAKQHLPRPA